MNFWYSNEDELNCQYPGLTLNYDTNKVMREQLNFIDQYLDINSMDNHEKNLEEEEKQEDSKIQFSDSIASNIEIEKQESQNSTFKDETSETKKKRSLFHNFQKHLVTTLKRNIKIKRKKLQNKQNLLASQMWENFLKSKFYNKKVLYFLFGVIKHGQAKLCYQQFTCNEYPPFKQIFENHYEGDILAAQQFLRNQVVEQSNRIFKIDGLVNKNRRVDKYGQFQQYFKEFVLQIEDGPLYKRMPKGNKKKLVDIIQHKKEV